MSATSSSIPKGEERKACAELDGCYRTLMQAIEQFERDQISSLGCPSEDQPGSFIVDEGGSCSHDKWSIVERHDSTITSDSKLRNFFESFKIQITLAQDHIKSEQKRIRDDDAQIKHLTEDLERHKAAYKVELLEREKAQTDIREMLKKKTDDLQKQQETIQKAQDDLEIAREAFNSARRRALELEELRAVEQQIKFDKMQAELENSERELEKAKAKFAEEECAFEKTRDQFKSWQEQQKTLLEEQSRKAQEALQAERKAFEEVRLNFEKEQDRSVENREADNKKIQALRTKLEKEKAELAIEMTKLATERRQLDAQRDANLSYREVVASPPSLATPISLTAQTLTSAFCTPPLHLGVPMRSIGADSRSVAVELPRASVEPQSATASLAITPPASPMPSSPATPERPFADRDLQGTLAAERGTPPQHQIDLGERLREAQARETARSVAAEPPISPEPPGAAVSLAASPPPSPVTPMLTATPPASPAVRAVRSVHRRR